ncbi:MAG: DUF4185 domain-containing protein [Actinomycetota bacterium]|nr:DUF4185 domain-containing protein [Actinomycetota bacterium]
MSRVHVSLIQSDYGLKLHGNFEAVITQGAQLWHWFRDNSRNDFGPWVRGTRITSEQDTVTAPGCLIQSDYRAGIHGNFEVIVPLGLGNGTSELRHFYRDNNDPHLPWFRGTRVTGDHDNVAGAACLIQSDYRTGSHGNFEVVVPLRQSTGTTELWHFYRDNNDPRQPWIRGLRVTGDRDNVAGAACLIQSDFGAGAHGNFEVVVPLQLGNGAIELRHFYHDNSDVRLPWTKAQLITQSCAGSGSLIQSRFGTAGHGNFEVIVDECRDAVAHYWHPNFRLGEWWIRTDCFTMLQPYPLLANRARKVAQLTGEIDREGWNGTGTPSFARNRTESRFGIIGTDLGSSFTHLGRIYFLFGDTWRVGHSTPNDDLDSIAFSSDKTADGGIGLTFLPRPPLVPGIPQGGFNVPLDGVSWGGNMYVFFSTDARNAGIYALMGRSIVARSTNGLDFTLLYEVSRYKFVNVSASIVDAQDHGLPGNGPQFVVFGSGRYRSSDVYLAIKPAAKLSEPGGFLFYVGGTSQPRWSSDEEAAAPLIGAGCVGELSVRWNSVLGVWICLYNADWPADRAFTGGIVMHWAKHPWGPWSAGNIAFAVNDGLGKFMHLPNVDHTQEGFGIDRSAELGGMYGPYQIPQYARATDNGAQIYFTMSAWNPYQVMLMTVEIPAPLE